MTDNNSDLNDLAKEWYRFAVRDFMVAKHLNETMYPKPIENICYQCQQSAEKFLKGFLISNRIIDPPKTHDLIQLRTMCAEINEKFEEVRDICQRLTRYGVQPRYPNEIEILESDAEAALQNAREMIEFYKSQGIDLE